MRINALQDGLFSSAYGSSQTFRSIPALALAAIFSRDICFPSRLQHCNLSRKLKRQMPASGLLPRKLNILPLDCIGHEQASDGSTHRDGKAMPQANMDDVVVRAI